jgi:hypothetical protein
MSVGGRVCERGTVELEDARHSKTLGNRGLQ